MDLTALLSPKSIAVVGASDDPNRLGGRVLANVLKGFGTEFDGVVTPVNPSHEIVQGLAAAPSVRAMTTAPDLALVVAPVQQVLQIARECAETGVGAMIVITSGFGEVGEQGQTLQDELTSIAREGNVALLGPNCAGILNLAAGMRASFFSLPGVPLRPGNVAVVSQSGAFGQALFEYAQESGVATSYLCTTGNEAGVTSSQLIAHLVEDIDVGVIVAYFEGLPDPDVLLAAGWRALELNKPILAMKVGGSDVGRRAAVSHTGAHWVPDRLIDAVFDRAGIVRFHSPREMIECANGLSAGRLPRGRTFAVLTGSGGVGVAMADAAMAAGLEMPEPSPVLRGELESLLPSFASVLNPIDHTAQILNSRSSYADFFRAIAADPQYDVLCLAGVTRFLPSERLDEMVQIARRAVPVVVAQTHYADVAQELSSRGLPTVGDPVSAVRMVAGMVAYAAHRQWLLDGGAVASAWAPSASPFSETHVTQAPHEAKLILEGAGIPFVAERLVDGLEQAMRALDELGPPVALKLSSASLPHKTDVGGVLLDIRTAEDVARGLATFADIAQRKSLEDAEIRVVMQAMTSRGIEILCGGLRDPVLGPVVTVGLGGILVEHLGAQECGLAPLDQRYAMLMLERLFRGRLRGGSRDLTAVQAEIVADILVRIGQLLVDRPDISEVELNPVIAAKEGVVAVDALVVTTDIGRKPSSVLRSQ